MNFILGPKQLVVSSLSLFRFGMTFESPKKKLKLSHSDSLDLDAPFHDHEDDEAEVLSWDGDENESTNAGSEGQFEIVDGIESDCHTEVTEEADFEVVAHSDLSEDDKDQQEQWWASGPCGPLRFLMQLEGQLLQELVNYGLSSSDCLGPTLGWVADMSSLMELAIDAEIS